MPFVLGKFIFPEIKKNATTFIVMGSWEEIRRKWNGKNIVLFECSRTISKLISCFTKKNILFGQGNHLLHYYVKN